MKFKLEWRIPAALLVFVAGFAAVTVLRSNYFPWIQPGPTLLDRLENGEFNTVFLGDSRVYMGISPEVIDRVAGNDVRSCIRGGTALRMNQRYLDVVSELVRKRGVKIVVTGLTGGEFSGYGFSEERDYVLMHNKSLWRRVDDSAALLPIEKSEFKNLLSRHATSGGREYRYTNGWWAFVPNTSKRDLTHNLSYYKNVFGKGGFRNDLFARFLEAAKAWRHAGATVCFYLPPTCREMNELETRLGVDYAYMAAEAKKAGLIELPVDAFGYVSFDGSHLAKIEAERFSVALGIELKKILERDNFR